jgi:hypothetical protein
LGRSQCLIEGTELISVAASSGEHWVRIPDIHCLKKSQHFHMSSPNGLHTDAAKSAAVSDVLPGHLPPDFQSLFHPGNR